jgi:hypothetical protein
VIITTVLYALLYSAFTGSDWDRALVLYLMGGVVVALVATPFVWRRRGTLDRLVNRQALALGPSNASSLVAQQSAQLAAKPLDTPQ